ncbi:TPA: isopeptide-forming domain-containing fimbrial protein [Enterococcus faecalis]
MKGQMYMKWKKGISIAGTLIMLLGQNIAGMTAFAETVIDPETTSESEELYFEKEGQPLNEVTVEKEKTAAFTFVDTNKEDAEAVIELPAAVTLDQEQTNQQLTDGSTVAYDAATNKVTVKMNQGNGKEVQKINLVVKGTQETGGNPQQFYAQTKRADGRNYRSKAVQVTVSGQETPNTGEPNGIASGETGEEANEDGDSDSAPVANKSAQETRERPQVRAGNKNVDLDISPASGTVLAGQDATYILNFKVTGNQTSYTNAKITVDIPREYVLNQDLSELAIAGVTPTRDANTGQLLYTFPSISAGQTYTTNIKVKTNNGTTPDGTSIPLVSNFSADEFTGKAESKATVTVKSSLSISSSKAYVSTIGSNGKKKLDPPTGGDISNWSINVTASQKDVGVAYFKEGSKITIKDMIPSGLTYVTDDSNGVYDKATNTVTWTFDAPNYETQQSAAEYLFSKKITIQTKFNADVNEFADFENKMSVTAIDIAGKSITSESSATIKTGPSNPNELPDTNGSFWINTHTGPQDGLGNTNYGGQNPDPTVYDTALLSFNFNVKPQNATSPTKDFTKYNIVYDIDPNLNLEAINFAGSAHLSPYPSYPGNGPYLKSEPRANISIVVDGKERQVAKNTLLWDNKKYDLSHEALGLKENEHVSQIKIQFTNAPAGMFSNGVYPQFTVKKGYVGTVTNKVHYDIAGFNVHGDPVTWNNDAAVENVNAGTGYRTAEVVPVPPATNPIAKSSIRFEKSNNGVVEVGNNRVNGGFSADSASVLPLSKPLEAMVLLPVGVKVDMSNPEFQLGNIYTWDEKTANGKNENGTIQIVSDNYKSTSRQLLKVSWNDSTVYPGKMVNYAFNVKIDKTAPTPLRMDTYGFSGDEKVKVPTGASTLTDSYLQTDTDDLDGDGNVTEPRVLSSNQYRLIKENQIQTTKLVKGDQDKSFSKFGHASPNGTIQYQLTMKNTGSEIGTFALMDVLPSVGDLGITDNVGRNSQFAPLMTGPITLPGEWNGKVTVKYSEATNPQRDDLDKLVDYPATTQHLENPAGAQAPVWKTASQVTDWSKIHSFMVILDEGKWTSGTAITLNFSMKAPNNLTRNLTDASKDEKTRAAWNSFAYTAENSQVVEPERVGVVVNATEPIIHKDVEKQQHLDLSKRDQAFDWHVNTTFGDGTGSWTQASIVDPINPLLTINSVKVVDETGTDVTGNGSLTTEKNKVVFTINKKDGSFAYLAGHTYTMTINTSIGKDVTDEQLAPYIKDGGIPNQADLNFGNKGDVIHSEIPTVVPPEENPDIHKDIEDQQHLDLSTRDQAHDWHVKTTFGNTTASWTQASIVDPINLLLTINSVKVVDETGADVTGNGTLTTEKNKVVFTLNKKDGSYTYLAGHTYTMTINTSIGKDVTDEQLAPYIKDGGIPNQADLNFGNEGDVIHSEIPTVVPPKENPDIHKDVEDSQHLDLTNRDQTFNWHVKSTFGNTTASWSQASIVDPINPLLTINSVKVVDETGADVTGNGTLTTEKNKVVFTLNKKDGSYTYLAGHTYTMTINTSIGKDVTDEQLAPYIKNSGIPNQADLNFGDEGDVLHSEIPTVVPPKENPDIHKDVEDSQHLDLTNRDQTFNWHVKSTFGNTTASWTQASIVDQINPLLTINDVKVTDETGKDVTANGTVDTVKNKITYTLNKKTDGYTYLAGHTYTMTINTSISKETTDEQLAPYIKDGGIPNQADLNFGNDGDVLHSEIPTVVPPKEEPDIHKDVENSQHLDLTDRNQAFDWHVVTNFGTDTAGWHQVSIVDSINPLLTINHVKVVDETGKDVTGNGTLTTENNKVVFTLNKKADGFTYLAGHTYTMTINTSLRKDVTEEQLAPYIKEGGVPNQADLTVDNDTIHSEIPKVDPPKPEKKVPSTESKETPSKDKHTGVFPSTGEESTMSLLLISIGIVLVIGVVWYVLSKHRHSDH